MEVIALERRKTKKGLSSAEYCKLQESILGQSLKQNDRRTMDAGISPYFATGGIDIYED